jgi:CRP-like cAMP-binding protein
MAHGTYDHLDRSVFLHHLAPGLKQAFLDRAELLRFEVNTPILRQGSASPGMYLISSGAVEITCASSTGQAVILHVARPGESLGELEAITGNACVANCIALRGAELLLCPRDTLAAFLAEPDFSRALMQVFHDRMRRDNEAKFVDQGPVEERLSTYLYQLSSAGPVIRKTQADLAGLVGCARQTLNRELGRLRDQNLIALEKGRVRVLNREALRQQTA